MADSVFYYLPQLKTTTLSTVGGIDASQTTGITLTSVSNVDTSKPGIIAVSWSNPIDTSAIEYITYTSIDGSNALVGATRGAEDSTGRVHSAGVTVAFVVSKSHITEMAKALDGTNTGVKLNTPKVVTSINDTNGNEIIKTPATSSAVNEITVTNAATGNAPEISATGGDTNIDVSIKPKGTGVVNIKGTSDSAAEIRLFEDTDNGSNYMAFKAPSAVTTSKTLTLPDGDGSSGQTLITNGSGTLSWGSSGSTDGWTTDTGTTWTYASATTINVADGTIFQKGDRIKLTQTTAKYFVVVSISGNVITVTGGTDYTVANAAITTQQYSHQLNPLGYPTWFNYSPTLTGFSSNPTNTVNQFKIEGNTCVVSIRQATSGTSNATTFTITLPVTAKTITNQVWIYPAQVVDNGAVAMGDGYINSAGTVVNIEKNWGAFTASGNKSNPSGLYTYQI